MTTKTQEGIIVYSTKWCSDCKRVKKFFGEQRIPYTNIDIENNPEAMAFVEKVNNGMRIIPTIICGDGSILSEPSNAELAVKLGLTIKARRGFYDAIIIGSGPAGLTAAIFLTRERLDTLVIERGGLGGQVSMTQTMENFPGFYEGISGSDFADRLVKQARRFGTEILQAQDVLDIRPDGQYLSVSTSDGSEYGCKAALLATGAQYRRLGVPGEEELIGINIHFCATCDAAFYRNKKVLVIGGGNSGFQEGLFISKFADEVDIVEFLPQVKASPILQESVARNPKMKVITNHLVRGFRGNGKLEGIAVEDRATHKLIEWYYDGVFIFIGLSPNAEFIKDKIKTNSFGFIETDKTLMTSMPGLFAAGDVRAESTKQAASAAGEGATAALMIRQYLDQEG